MTVGHYTHLHHALNSALLAARACGSSNILTATKKGNDQMLDTHLHHALNSAVLGDSDGQTQGLKGRLGV